MPEVATCSKCGRSVARTRSRHLRAHDCPHGFVCVLSYAERKTGARPGGCLECFRDRQEPLFKGLR